MSPARRASSPSGAGGEAHKSLVSEAASMAQVTTTNNALPTVRTVNDRYQPTSPPSPLSPQQQQEIQTRGLDRVVSISESSAAESESDGPLRQFPITKTFGRASWANRSWYGRSWHGRSWHASQTFAPPMAKLPDVPIPPPAAKYSVFPRTNTENSSSGESSVYEGTRTGQASVPSFYGTDHQSASGNGSPEGGGRGGGAAREMEVPQVVIYSATPRVSAQTPVIVDPEYTAAQGIHSREASQGSVQSVSRNPRDSSMEARDGSRDSSTTAAGGRGRSEAGVSLVEVMDLPRQPQPTAAAAPTTLSRFSQVSDLSSASANTGYSWDDGASEPYTADRASTLSRIAGGFGLSIVADRNRSQAASRPGYGQGGRPR